MGAQALRPVCSQSAAASSVMSSCQIRRTSGLENIQLVFSWLMLVCVEVF